MGHYTFGLPRQKLRSSQKTKEWFQQCVDAICNHQQTVSFANGRTSRHNKQVNRNLYNSDFDEEDFAYLNPHKDGKYGDMPAKLQSYNIIRNRLEVLIGEEIQRPFFFMARGVGGEVMNIKQQKKKDLLIQYCWYEVNRKLGIQNQDGEPPMLPERIQRYMESEFLDGREITANQLLSFFERHLDLVQKFNVGFEDAVVEGEEIYGIGIKDGHPHLRNCSAINLDFDLDDDQQWVQKANWVREERWLTPGSILDLWGEQLEDDDVQAIDDGDMSFFGNHGWIGDGSGMAFFDKAPNLLAANTSSHRPANGILVTTVCWRGMELHKVVKYPDPQTGEMQEAWVDDTFELTGAQKRQGWSLEEFWRSIIYTGTRIGYDRYVDMKPLEYQNGHMPYVGYVYNARHAQSVSLVDLCKQHQYMYMVVMWYIEMAMARNKGKKTIIDLAHFPKSQGMTMEEQQFYFDTFGILYINSAERDERQAQSNWNGYTTLDMSSGQEIQSHILMLEKIEQQIDMVTGVNRNRQGQTRASETATAQQSSIAQSSSITEKIFYIHNLVKKCALQELLEVAKVAYADGTSVPLVDEIYNSILHVDGETFPDSDYYVYVSNSSKDFQDLQKAEQVAGQMAMNGNLDMSTYMRLLGSKSVSEYQHYIVKAEQMKRENEERLAQQEQESAERQVQMKVAADQQKVLNDNEQKELDRQNKIQIATISALKGKDGPSDVNQNGVADPIEHARLALEMSANNASIVAQSEKNAIDAAKVQSSHEATMRKLDVENEKLNQAARKLELDNQKLEREAQMFVREQDQQDRENVRQEQDAQLKVQSEAQKLQLQREQQQQDRQLEEKRLAQEVRENEKDRKLQLKLKAREVAQKREEILLQMQQKEHEHRTDVELAQVEAKTKQVEVNADIKKMQAQQQHQEHKVKMAKAMPKKKPAT